MRRYSLSLKTQSQAIDKPLLFVVLGLVLFGLVMILNVSVVEAAKLFGDKFFFVKRQIIWAGLGILLMSVLAAVPYRFFRGLAVPLFWATVGLLIAVLIPGIGTVISGARRWLELGPIVIQPSELAKPALIIYLAHIFSKQKSFLPFLFAVGLVLGLVIFEPDMGTGVVLGTVSLLLYFASGAPIAYFFASIPLLALAILGLALSSEYRKARLLTFLDPTTDPLGASYHVRQIIIALGSGGLFGLGLGQSRQKYLFLPEPTTDSIFAIIGEELGFLGASLVLLAFLFLIWRGLRIALGTQDPFGRFLAVGITSWLGIQAFINLGAMVALVPLTGVPLPFLSYGGSSLVAGLAGIGIILNVSRYRQGTK